MKRKIISIIGVLLLLTAAHQSFGQYFQKLYDIDSSYDWGMDIFVLSDGSYFVKTEAGISNIDHGYWALVNMKISADGSTILNERIVTDSIASLYGGANGGIILLPGGGYLSPLSINVFYGSYNKASAGLVKYNAVGDTVFLKTFTDKSVYFEGMICCAIMPGGGYIAGGTRELNSSSYYKGLIARTDSMGDTLWTRTYQLDTTDLVQIDNIIPLADGRIVVGATSSRLVNPGPDAYYSDAAWFMVLDSTGSIISDTVYSMGGGNILPDKNGGYVIWGSYDSVNASNPDDIRNFPNFIAHVDSNFRMTWITEFPYTPTDEHRAIWMIRQLSDSSYVAVGDQLVTSSAGSYGWGAKVSRNGEIVWNRYYLSDTAKYAALRDVAERPDGSLIFTGTTMNDTLPTWHQTEDVWLVSVDSNGCENGWCVPALVNKIKPTNSSVLVYPNPATSVVNFQYAYQNNVTIKIIDITGRLMDEQTLQNSSTSSFNLTKYAPGIYLYQFRTDGEVQSGKVMVE